MKANDCIFIMEYNIHGIPCIIGVTYYDSQKPDHTSWSSDVDFFGFEDIEYNVFDRKGYTANWLAKKITQKDHDDIIMTLSEKMKVTDY